MIFSVAFAITWCPTIVKQSLDELSLVPYLDTTFNQDTQSLDVKLNVPYTSDNSKYTYVVDFGNRTFKFSNFDNKSDLNNALKQITQTPTAEYACSNKAVNAFNGGKNWNVVVDNCNYVTFTTSVPLSSTVFKHVQESGNVQAYTATLYLFRVSPNSESRIRTRTTMNDEYIFNIRIEQRIQTGYDSKDLNKLHYFVPNVNVQDEPSVFQSKIDGSMIKTYLSIDRLQIMKVSSDKNETIQYDNLDRAASCSHEGKERIFNTTLRQMGDNTRTLEVIYSNIDCVKNVTNSQDILKVYITELVTVTVDQVASHPQVSMMPVNQTIHKLVAPVDASKVSGIYCDGKKLSGGVFNRSQCKNLELNYTINDVIYTYKTQIAEIAGDTPALYVYEPYETLTNMSWNKGLLCKNTQEDAFIVSKNTFCQANPIICEQVDAPVEEEEETPVTPPETPDTPSNNTNSSNSSNSSNTTNPPTNSSQNNTNSTDKPVIPPNSSNTTDNSSINSTQPEPEECIGDDCAYDGVGHGKIAIVGAAAAAAAAIGILI